MTRFWHPTPLFAGRPVFVVGGGPSLRAVDLDSLRPWATIVVNEYVCQMPWATALFFNDTGFWLRRQRFIEAFRGRIFTSSSTAKHKLGDRAARLVWTKPRRRGAPLVFPPTGHPELPWGPTSGHKAVALAVAAGAPEVYLLGMDCRLVDGRSHGHDSYSYRDVRHIRSSWLPAWSGWAAAARAAGSVVMNATDGSALEEFPRVQLAPLLAELQTRYGGS